MLKTPFEELGQTKEVVECLCAGKELDKQVNVTIGMRLAMQHGAEE